MSMGFSRQDYGNGLPFPSPVGNLHTLSIPQYNLTRGVAILFEAHLNMPVLCTFIQILPTFIPLTLLSIRIQVTNFGLRGGFLEDFFLLFLFPVHFTYFDIKKLWDPQSGGGGQVCGIFSN